MLETRSIPKGAKVEYKIDIVRDGNLMPIDMFKILFSLEQTMAELAKYENKKSLINNLS